MIFVDASAMIAAITFEPGADQIFPIFVESQNLLTSPVALWETVAALVHQKRMSVHEAEVQVTDFITGLKIAIVPIGEAELAAALDAYARYGKGRHSARLNMGDCFAYACARTKKADLLAVGDDFARTDVRLAQF